VYKQEKRKFERTKGKNEKTLSSSQLNNNLYIFRVTLAKSWIRAPFLEEVDEPPYPVIAVLGKTTPYRPGLTIIDAFEFDFDHLFDFFDNTKNWINSKVRYELKTDLEGDEGIVDLKKLFSDLPPEKYKLVERIIKNLPTKKGVKKVKVCQVFT
jgi:hypothetical protein